MTFMNEIDGEAYRVQITNVYTSRENKNEDNSPLQANKLKSRSKSLMRLIESFEQEQREKEREKEKDENKNMQRVYQKVLVQLLI